MPICVKKIDMEAKFKAEYDAECERIRNRELLKDTWYELLHIAFRRSYVSMLRELFTHNSLCFEFVELTLLYLQ